MISSNSALWMSKDGHMMLYATFNDSLVEEQKFPWYGGGEEAYLYPEIRSLRYPKPGTPNPIVTLTVADLADPKNIRTRNIKPPPVLGSEGFVFSNIFLYTRFSYSLSMRINYPIIISLYRI